MNQNVEEFETTHVIVVNFDALKMLQFGNKQISGQKCDEATFLKILTQAT